LTLESHIFERGGNLPKSGKRDEEGFPEIPQKGEDPDDKTESKGRSYTSKTNKKADTKGDRTVWGGEQS